MTVSMLILVTGVLIGSQLVEQIADQR